jgi:ABC-type sugar transport system permease subunit
MTSSALPRPLARLTPARRRELWAIVKALLYLGPSLFIFVAFIFYPLLQSVNLSLYATDPIGRPSVFVGLEQYQKLLSAPGSPPLRASANWAPGCCREPPRPTSPSLEPSSAEARSGYSRTAPRPNAPAPGSS